MAFKVCTHGCPFSRDPEASCPPSPDNRQAGLEGWHDVELTHDCGCWGTTCNGLGVAARNQKMKNAEEVNLRQQDALGLGSVIVRGSCC